ncbi:MAG TPA: hypothetical protein VEI96_02300 [Thermodesulfovibrionales bacterium]|nr:hypothetical protein [Thermodesulfovibrionales bacterium]
MKNLLLLFLAAVVLTACSAYLTRVDFDDSLNAYNQALRWHEWDKASSYAADAIHEEFRARAAAARDVRVTDFRIVGENYNAEKRQATAEVEIDYYSVFSYTMKTLRDTQRWMYVDEKGIRGWRLESLPPEFR